MGPNSRNSESSDASLLQYLPPLAPLNHLATAPIDDQASLHFSLTKKYIWQPINFFLHKRQTVSKVNSVIGNHKHFYSLPRARHGKPESRKTSKNCSRLYQQ